MRILVNTEAPFRLLVLLIYSVLMLPSSICYGKEKHPLSEKPDKPYFYEEDNSYFYKSDWEVKAEQCALSYRRKQLSNLTNKLLRSTEKNSPEKTAEMVSLARLLISGDFDLPEFKSLQSVSGMNKTITAECLPDYKCDFEHDLCFKEPPILSIDHSTLEKEIINYKKASELFLEASKAGNDEATIHLAEMYATGRGMPVDSNAALDMVLSVAKKGNLHAQWDAAQLYRGEPAVLWFLGESNGGVISNKKLSYMWFNIAAGNGLDQAANMRTDISKKLSQQELSQAQKMSTECIKSSYKTCGDGENSESGSWWRFWKK